VTPPNPLSRKEDFLVTKEILLWRGTFGVASLVAAEQNELSGASEMREVLR
jgi:hypothetical protein